MKGTLFYVIGPSGVGKDTLMQYARAHLDGEKKVLFIHRYITRAAEMGGENHVALTENEFLARLKAGVFLFHWQSHGNYYGIGKELQLFLDLGFNVVMNGSRAYLPEATHIIPDLKPIVITASLSVIRERLIKRGRESNEDIEKRLERVNQFEVTHEEAITINNDYHIEHAGNTLIELLSTN